MQNSMDCKKTEECKVGNIVGSYKGCVIWEPNTTKQVLPSDIGLQVLSISEVQYVKYYNIGNLG